MHVIDKIAEKVRTRCQQQQGVGPFWWKAAPRTPRVPPSDALRARCVAPLPRRETSRRHGGGRRCALLLSHHRAANES